MVWIIAQDNVCLDYVFRGALGLLGLCLFETRRDSGLQASYLLTEGQRVYLAFLPYSHSFVVEVETYTLKATRLKQPSFQIITNGAAVRGPRSERPSALRGAVQGHVKSFDIVSDKLTQPPWSLPGATTDFNLAPRHQLVSRTSTLPYTRWHAGSAVNGHQPLIWTGI